MARGKNNHYPYQRGSNEPRHSARVGEKAYPASDSRFEERDRIVKRHFMRRAGLPDPEKVDVRLADISNPELPIYNKKTEIQNSVRDNRVVLLGGETGSGKTTSIGPYLAEMGYEKVFILLPRRCTVDNVGDYMKKTVSDKIDAKSSSDLIGTAHSELVDMSDENKIVYMTPMTYMRMAKKIEDDFGDKPIAVVCDEIHEANFPTEIATSSVALQMTQHENWRLVVSSATHDAANVDRALETLNGKPIPHIGVEGRPHELEYTEMPTATEAEAYAMIGRDHQHTLCFTSGKQEIDDTINDFRKALEENKKGSANDIEFRKLHADISYQEKANLDLPVPEGKRVVVVATNAAMSGITLPGTTLVLSDGEVKRSELDDDKVLGLRKDLSSRAELTQKAGRAGRDVAGGVFVLCKPRAGEFIGTNSECRQDHAPAEIYHTNLARTALTLAVLEQYFHEINQFAIHPVEPSAILQAQESLFRLGALDEDDAATQRGEDMDLFPLRPELSRAVVEAWKGGRSPQTIARVAIIAASVDAGGLASFAHDAGDEWKKLIRPETNDDYLAQLDMYQAIHDPETGYLESELESAIKDINARQAYIATNQLKKVMRVFGIHLNNLDLPPPNDSETQEIKQCLTAGMVDLVYKKINNGDRRSGPIYHDILSDDSAVDRTLSSRSVIDRPYPELMVAWPRWYETRKDVRNENGKLDKILQKVNIVETAMEIDVDMLRPYIDGLTTVKEAEPRMSNGRVIERARQNYGALDMGSTEVPQTRALGEAGKQLLENTVIENPGPALQALRETKRRLEKLQAKVTPAQAEYLFEKPIIKDEQVRRILARAVAESRSTKEFNSALRSLMYEHEISVDSWITPENMQIIIDSSPDNIQIGETSYPVHYQAGQPYATRLDLNTVDQMPDEIYLDDGRMVKFQVKIGRQKKRLTLGEIRAQAT